MTTGTKRPRQELEEGGRLSLVGEITQQRQEPAAAGLVAAACECLELVRRARENDGGPVRGEHLINEMAADVAGAAGEEDRFAGEGSHGRPPQLMLVLVTR